MLKTKDNAIKKICCFGHRFGSAAATNWVVLNTRKYDFGIRNASIENLQAVRSEVPIQFVMLGSNKGAATIGGPAVVGALPGQLQNNWNTVDLSSSCDIDNIQGDMPILIYIRSGGTHGSNTLFLSGAAFHIP